MSYPSCSDGKAGWGGELRKGSNPPDDGSWEACCNHVSVFSTVKWKLLGVSLVLCWLPRQHKTALLSEDLCLSCVVQATLAAHTVF